MGSGPQLGSRGQKQQNQQRQQEGEEEQHQATSRWDGRWQVPGAAPDLHADAELGRGDGAEGGLQRELEGGVLLDVGVHADEVVDGRGIQRHEIPERVVWP